MLTGAPALTDVLERSASRLRCIQRPWEADSRIETLRYALLDAVTDLHDLRPERALTLVQIARRILQIYRLALHLAATGPAHARPELEVVTGDLAAAHVDLDLLVVYHSTLPHGGSA